MCGVLLMAIFRNEKEVVILDIENGKLVKVDERTLKVIQNKFYI